jgi:hypothetical protein
MDTSLPRYCDVYDIAALVVGAIDSHLTARGMQLEPTGGEALRHALESILRLMQVEFLDHDGNPVDPNLIEEVG